MSLLTPTKVRNLQRRLSAKAKGSEGHRFYALYEKVNRADIPGHAYGICRFNGGAAYGRFYRLALYPLMYQLDRSLARWAYRKYKNLRGICVEQRTGWHSFHVGIQGSLHSGRYACGLLPWRGPDEL